MTPRRVLVTGASGFVGRHLVDLLGRQGIAVCGLGPEGLAAGFEPAAWRQADVLDLEAVSGAVSELQPDTVVHLAGQASAGRSFRDQEITFRVNVLGTRNLLEAVRRHAPSARVLAIGSGESYGPQLEGSRVAEPRAFRPVSPYALSKAVADEIALAYATAHGLDIVRTRSFSHAGPGQGSGFALPSFASQIAAFERAGRDGVLQVGNLDVTRDILDVRDVAEGYLALIKSGRPGEAYNVCSGTGVRLSDVVGMLIGLAGVGVRVDVDPARVRPADVPYLVGDPAKVERETSWRPGRSLRHTLEDLLNHHRSASYEV